MSESSELRRIAEKARLRVRMRETLAAIPVAERREKSERAVALLAALPALAKAANLLLHRPLPTELDIDAYLTEAVARGRRVFVPRVEAERLLFVRVSAKTAWRRSTLGVLEPVSGEPLEHPDLERGETVIVVPGLAFSPHGERLGRGGGHYDRLLKEIRAAGRVEAIGLAFDLQIVPTVPALDHDVRVDRVITDERVIQASLSPLGSGSG